MTNSEIELFTKGVHNLLPDEDIPKEAATDEVNWYTQDGRIKLVPGRSLVGNEGVAGKITGEIFGYKVDGSKVHWRKEGTKIQYNNNGTWTDVVTGLTSTADYSFANYSSLAGTFTYAFGYDGIYKMHNACPGSYLSLYHSARNFKGKAIIDKGRAILWDRAEDKTGLYGSYIDTQKAVASSLNVYTQVTSEVLGASGSTTYTGFVKVKKNTFTVTIASPGVFSCTAHGLASGNALVFSTTGALPTGLTAGTTYYVISAGLTADAFQVAATPGGTAINTSGSQSGTHSFVTTTRNIFAFTPSGTTAGGTETFTDNYLGVLTGSLGGTGTINYITGEYSITFSGAVTSGNVTANYQWEDATVRGVADFTKSATRQAGEGFQFPQDEGGDAILSVLIGPDGYYSMKRESAYLLTIDETDTNADNNVYRKGIGIQSYRGAVVTSKGIVFMNMATPEKPELTILQKNAVGDAIEPYVLFSHFKFADYTYDDCTIDFYERYIVVACKSAGAEYNDTVLLCDILNKTVDITRFSVRTFARDSGDLYAGSSVTANVYKLYDGVDDDGSVIQNYWISKGETYSSSALKKFRKLRLRGLIARSQNYSVYINYDDSGYQLVGTVRGDANYVDLGSSQPVGTNMLGTAAVGGDTLTEASPYFAEIRLKKVPKFNKRKIKFVANSYGYVDIDYLLDWDISLFQDKIPARFRQKQNVSLDGDTENVDNPEF